MNSLPVESVKPEQLSGLAKDAIACVQIGLYSLYRAGHVHRKGRDFCLLRVGLTEFFVLNMDGHALWKTQDVSDFNIKAKMVIDAETDQFRPTRILDRQ